MQTWRKRLALVLGVAVAAAACSRIDQLAAPGEARYDTQPALPPGEEQTPQGDQPPADSTDERWGGLIGGGR